MSVFPTVACVPKCQQGFFGSVGESVYFKNFLHIGSYSVLIRFWNRTFLIIQPSPALTFF